MFFRKVLLKIYLILLLLPKRLIIPAARILFTEGDISDSLYIVVEGKVKLHRAGTEIMIAKEKDVFGTWALFDNEPRVATATTQEDCRLLRLDKEEFYDLLADHSRITQDILKTLSLRLRRLIQNV